MSRHPAPRLPLLASLLAPVALAAPQDPAATPETETRPLLEITVTASPLGRTADDLVQPVTVLAGEALANKRRATIGQTLEQEAGISSTDFGAGAGRPVIRGQAGPRVEVLENGVSAMDVSNLSPDHAVAINPMQASQIEVIKGPATLLYGGNAIGGVVNVGNRRLVNEITPGRSGAFETWAGSAAQENGASGDLNYGSGEHQWHADFTSSRAGDYRIPGAANSDGSGPRGRLPNSASEQNSGALAWNHVNAAGDAYGIALSDQHSVYGLPVEPAAFIDQQQQRVDTQALLRNPADGIESLRIRASQARYRHTEYEDAATPGTRFRNDEFQSRLEAVHQAVAGFRGVLGAQLGRRDFAAIGDEAYVQPVKTASQALFVVEERPLPFGKLELGARVDSVSHDPDAASGDPSRRFTPLSASAGVIVNLAADSHLKLTASHAERAPAIEELYARGPHGATGTYEIGLRDARRERTREIEIGLDHHRGRLQLETSVFSRQARDYIYADFAGVTVDEHGAVTPGGDYKLVNYRQGPAHFQGYEVAATWDWLTSGPLRLSTRVFADQVRGTLDDAGPVPRLTPSRQGLSVHGHYRRLTLNLQYTHADSQQRISGAETPTAGYHLVNADLGWRLPAALAGGSRVELFLRGSNLLNDDIRRSTSFIKDSVPAPGRAVLAGLRLSF